VKFGQVTLNVDNVPDGHIIISEAEHANLKQSANALFLLKSKIPVGVDENQLSVLVEKGQRHDTLAQELDTHKKNVTSLTEKLNKFSNIPEGFSVEQWNKDRTKEKMEMRAGQFAEIEKSAFKEIETKFKIKPNIDKRFLPNLDEFDVTAKDAVEQYVKILDKAHTDQAEFVKNLQTKPNSEPVGGGPKTIIEGHEAPAQGIEPRHI
jgi:uncharacterized protein (DUF342 family)